MLLYMFSSCYHLYSQHHELTQYFWFCFCVVYRAFQIKGRIISYFMGLSKRPLTVFGICFSIVMSLILLTICISTILYCNAVKKSRINPESNYIKVVRRIKWKIFDTCTKFFFLLFAIWLLSVKEYWSTFDVIIYSYDKLFFYLSKMVSFLIGNYSNNS